MIGRLASTRRSVVAVYFMGIKNQPAAAAIAPTTSPNVRTNSQRRWNARTIVPASGVLGASVPSPGLSTGMVVVLPFGAGSMSAGFDTDEIQTGLSKEPL